MASGAISVHSRLVLSGFYQRATGIRERVLARSTHKEKNKRGFFSACSFSVLYHKKSGHGIVRYPDERIGFIVSQRYRNQSRPSVDDISYLDSNFSFAPLTPDAVASKMISPSCSPLCTIAVNWPLNSFICGRWNNSNDAGLPFAAAR